MTIFTITHDGSSYGTWDASTPAEALADCLQDNDPTRAWKITHLSDSPNYGKPAPRNSLSGNGGQDLQRFFYVEAAGKIAVFRSEAIPEND